jgi:hypothetical protein
VAKVMHNATAMKTAATTTSLRLAALVCLGILEKQRPQGLERETGTTTTRQQVGHGTAPAAQVVDRVADIPEKRERRFDFQHMQAVGTHASSLWHLVFHGQHLFEEEGRMEQKRKQAKALKAGGMRMREGKRSYRGPH